MNSFIQNLQAEAIDPNASVSSILRKAKIIANELKDKDFLEWIEKELNGYDKDGQSSPEYRKISGNPMGFNPMRGWIPFIIDDPEQQELLSNRITPQPIGELEDLIKRNKGNLRMSYPPSVCREFSRAVGLDTIFTLEISPSAVIRILDAVRDKVLDWAIKQESVIGAGGSGVFFKAKKEQIGSSSVNIEKIEQFSGNIGNLYDQSQVNTVNQFNSTELEKIKNIVEQIRQNIEQVDSAQKPEIEEQVKVVETELAAEQPKAPKIVRSLQAISSVFAQATGSAFAQGIFFMIQKLLEKG